MNVPLVTKDDFKMMLDLSKNTDETKETINKRIQSIHSLFHNELTMERQLVLIMLLLSDPCKYICSFIDQSFYVGYLRGYQKCIDEFIKESNLDKND